MDPGRWPAVILAGMVVSNCALVALTPILPFVDLPFHLAAATIYRYYGLPNNAFTAYFTIDALWGKPNIVHLLIVSSGLFSEVEAGNRLLYVLYMILFPLSIVLIIHRVGGNRWFSVVAMLFAYSYSVAWGFAPYTLGITFLLLFVWLMMRTDPTRSGTPLLLAGFLLLLYSIHVLTMLFAAVVFTAIWLSSRGPRAARIRCLFVVLVPAAVAWWWFSNEPIWQSAGTGAFLLRYYRSEFIRTFLVSRLRLLVFDNRPLYPPPYGSIVAACLSVPVLLAPVVFMYRERQWVVARASSDWAFRTLLTFAAAALACCLLLPDRIPGQTALYERFSVFLLLAAVFIASALPWRLSVRSICLISVVAVGYQAARLEYFLAFRRHTNTFSRDLMQVDSNKAVLYGLIYQPDFRGLPVYSHFSDYHIVRNLGIAATEATQFRFGTIRARTDRPPLPRIDTSPNDSFDVDGLHGVDYLLTHADWPRRQAIERVFDLSRESGLWRSYQRKQR